MKKFIKLVVLFIAVTFTANSTSTVLAAQYDVVNIPDAGFKACINSHFMGANPTDDVYEYQMTLIDRAPLARLDCSGYEISSIEGAQYFINIENLDFYNNNITDLSPLAGLTNLRSLGLNNNSISDLTPLSGLTNLTKVLLRDNNITDITALGNLTNLTYLPLANNNISDLTPLSNLTGLAYLYVEGNSISNLTPLANLVNLVRVNAAEQNVVFNTTTVDVDAYQLPLIYDVNGAVVEYTDLNSYTLVEGEATALANSFNTNVITEEMDVNYSGTVSQTVTYNTATVAPVEPVAPVENTETATLPKTGMEQNAALYLALVAGLAVVKKKFL